MLEGSEGTPFAGDTLLPEVSCWFFLLRPYEYLNFILEQVDITMERSSSLQSILTSHPESRMFFGSSEFFSQYYSLSRFIVHLPMSPFVVCHRMTTPNGRFMTQKKICLSMSDCKLDNALSICCFVAIKWCSI